MTDAAKKNSSLSSPSSASSPECGGISNGIAKGVANGELTFGGPVSSMNYDCSTPTKDQAAFDTQVANQKNVTAVTNSFLIGKVPDDVLKELGVCNTYPDCPSDDEGEGFFSGTTLLITILCIICLLALGGYVIFLKIRARSSKIANLSKNNAKGVKRQKSKLRKIDTFRDFYMDDEDLNSPEKKRDRSASSDSDKKGLNNQPSQATLQTKPRGNTHVIKLKSGDKKARKKFAPKRVDSMINQGYLDSITGTGKLVNNMSAKK